MPRITQDLPVREKHTRSAKEQASIEIKNYFRSKRTLQVIPENGVAVFPEKKPKKDKNNNNAKRSLSDINSDSSAIPQNQSKRDDKTSFSDAKRKKSDSSTPNIKILLPKIISSTPFDKTISKDINSNDPTSDLSLSQSSDDVVVVLDSSIESNSAVVVDSSVASTTQNDTTFGFDALHTDDETQSDGDAMPNAPYWSLYKNRIAIVIDQLATDTKIVDNFFGCKAESVNLRAIFPTSIPIARRRSTAVWNTPPRYSMLPKY